MRISCRTCVSDCKQGLGPCAECIGESFETCCGCIEKVDPKLPFTCDQLNDDECTLVMGPCRAIEPCIALVRRDLSLVFSVLQEICDLLWMYRESHPQASVHLSVSECRVCVCVCVCCCYTVVTFCSNAPLASFIIISIVVYLTTITITISSLYYAILIFDTVPSHHATTITTIPISSSSPITIMYLSDFRAGGPGRRRRSIRYVVLAFSSSMSSSSSSS